MNEKYEPFSGLAKKVFFHLRRTNRTKTRFRMSILVSLYLPLSEQTFAKMPFGIVEIRKTLGAIHLLTFYLLNLHDER